jgi:hypothetical protein
MPSSVDSSNVAYQNVANDAENVLNGLGALASGNPGGAPLLGVGAGAAAIGLNGQSDVGVAASQAITDLTNSGSGLSSMFYDFLDAVNGWLQTAEGIAIFGLILWAGFKLLQLRSGDK